MFKTTYNMMKLKVKIRKNTKKIPSRRAVIKPNPARKGSRSSGLAAGLRVISILNNWMSMR